MKTSKKTRKTLSARDRVHDLIDLIDDAYMPIIEERLDSFYGKTDSDSRSRTRRK